MSNKNTMKQIHRLWDYLVNLPEGDTSAKGKWAEQKLINLEQTRQHQTPISVQPK